MTIKDVMSTYRELLQTAREFLEKKGIADAGLDAWYLLAHVFGIDRADFFMYGDETVSPEKALIYKELVEKRAMHVPLQYITGTQQFMGLEFEVDENVLIPRQETELLAEEVLKVCKGKLVRDICTGSGCIIISLAVLGNLNKAVGTDISPKALEVAERNAKRHNAAVEFIQSDLLEKVKGSYDIIVSNPPYIKSDEYRTLMPEVRDHEPRLALDAGETGLVFYERIIKNLDKYLKPGGYVFFEIGYNQGKEVSHLLYEAGFENINVKKDYSGYDRIVCAKKRLNDIMEE